MLQIYLKGPHDSGFLELGEANSLEIESLMPLFDEDLSTGDFSLPIEIPWTENNRRIFGFNERLENFSTRKRAFSVLVYEHHFPVLDDAQLTILERNGQFSYRRGKFNASISGNRGRFGTLTRGKKLADLELGGLITFDRPTRQFATQVMSGIFPQYGYIAFAPVGFQDFIDTTRQDYDDEFLASDTVNQVVVSGSGPDDWTFGRLRSTGGEAAEGEDEYTDYYSVPFLRLTYVLRKCFEEFGFTVAGALVDDPDFEELFLFNNFAVERYIKSGRVDINRQISPKNHVPDMTIQEFMKGIFSTLAVYPKPAGLNRIELRYRAPQLRERKVYSIRDIVGADFESTYQDGGDKGTGWTLEYEWDSNDSYPGEMVKEFAGKELVATVPQFGDLLSLSIGRPLTTDDIALVERENLYYQVADGTAIPVKWDVWGDRMQPYKKGDGQESVRLAASTLCTFTSFDDTAGVLQRQMYLGCKQRGSFRSFKGRDIRSPFGLRIFYIKKLPVAGVNVPTSFYHSHTPDGVRVTRYSLALDGPDGLAVNFHNPFLELKEGMEVVKARINANRVQLKEIEDASELELNNVLYIPYKIERTIPTSEQSTLFMIPR